MRRRLVCPVPSVLSVVCLFLAAPAVAGEGISFEEIAAHNSNRVALSEEYAHLGVHFVTGDDGAVWDGMSRGDPGGWELEGTHGPSFVGMNGRSYSLSVWFDEPVPAFRVDVASASGADPGSVFVLEGYLDGALVESTRVTLGGVNEWFTAGLSADVDEVVWIGDRSGFRPFGADNMRWGLEAPSRLDVPIDVMPGSSENPLHPGSSGVVPVALLGTELFDALEADAESLRLGVDGAPAQAASMHMDDVNGDGWLDLVAHYRMQETGTAHGDTSICLTGETVAGAPFAGCDDIHTVPGHGAPASSRRRR